jgi:hypothetical protein
VPATLGDLVGVLGAAALVLQDYPMPAGQA